ncbi:MAG: hypothetical protein IJP89_00810 [Synergistaceae bacterium]|nr:hypothetical protein [Synergistaceae bacterium]MBR0257223.1 hypothetical protein [Synergistaceae bacterium]
MGKPMGISPGAKQQNPGHAEAELPAKHAPEAHSTNARITAVILFTAITISSL